MSSASLFYITHNKLDERTVNRLFVSAFLEGNSQIRPRSTFLLQYCILNDDAEYERLQEFLNCTRIDFGDKMSLEDLVKLFEFVISPADRIVTGAVYTPKRIREVILSNCLGKKDEEELRVISVADISCGCGGFLLDVAKMIHKKTGKLYNDIFLENIFGIDVQEYAIERTKILLSLLALLDGEDQNFSFNLLRRDTLDYRDNNWDERYLAFDVIVGNPPYVCSRNLPEETRQKLKRYEVCASGHPDLYIPFFKIAIDMLSHEGQLGFITMNTFLRSVNGRAIRKYFSQNKYAISIVDFRGYQVFESRNTYTCLFFLDKQRDSKFINYAVDDQGVLSDVVNYASISYSELDDIKGWSLNKYQSTTAIEAIGTQIKDYCDSRHGIATLSNVTYIFNPAAKDDNYYYLESGGDCYPIEKEICRDIINPNKLNSIDKFDLLIEKVIFPYRIENERAIIYETEEMEQCFPNTFAYLKAKKELLLKRDKGKACNYSHWYAFGRTQSLVLPRYKLFFPKFINRPLRCVICDAPGLLLYNGLAFVDTEKRKLKVLKAIIESELFWDYIRTNAKPYASGYYSLSGVDIKHFGIPNFTKEEENELLSINNKSEIERWLRIHYGVC